MTELATLDTRHSFPVTWNWKALIIVGQTGPYDNEVMAGAVVTGYMVHDVMISIYNMMLQHMRSPVGTVLQPDIRLSCTTACRSWIRLRTPSAALTAQ